MIFGYKVGHTNRLNVVSSSCIHSAHEMIVTMQRLIFVNG